MSLVIVYATLSISNDDNDDNDNDNNENDIEDPNGDFPITNYIIITFCSLITFVLTTTPPYLPRHPHHHLHNCPQTMIMDANLQTPLYILING